MFTCTIYYPGLLGPSATLLNVPVQDWPSAKALPSLSKLLQCADISALNKSQRKYSLEARVMELLGVKSCSEDVPAAHFRAKYYRHTEDASWCLDPIHIQIDMNEAILLGHETLALTEKEARLLIHDLNQHLKQDELYIEYCTPHQWLLKGRLDLTTSAISDVIYRNIHDQMPDGNDGMHWKKIINEIQMLLHNHAINQEREAQGKPVVNSLWLWGGGEYNAIESSIDLVITDHDMVVHVATLSGTACKSVPLQLYPDDLAGKDSLIILTEQMTSINRNDVYGWFRQLEYLDQRILQPAIKALSNKKITRLVLHTDNFIFVVKKKISLKWFYQFPFGRKSFRQQILGLQERYAE